MSLRWYAAIDWVVQHKDDPGLNIRILKLSFGTSTMQDATLDPLSLPAEVGLADGGDVVAAGDRRQCVGESDQIPPSTRSSSQSAPSTSSTLETGAGVGDTIASFSSRGAQAVRLISLLQACDRSFRDPDRFIDTTHPEGRADDQAGPVPWERDVAGHDHPFGGSGVVAGPTA